MDGNYAKLKKRTHTDRTSGSSINRKRPRKRSKGKWIVLLILLVLAAGGGYLGYRRFGPGTTWSDYRNYFGVGADGCVVYQRDRFAAGHVLEKDGRRYLPMDLAAQADCRWYQSKEGLLLYTLAEETVQIAPGAHAYTRGGKETDAGYEICFESDGTLYVSLDFIAEFSGAEITDVPVGEEKDLPERIFLQNDWGSCSVASVRRSSEVRQLAGSKSPILTRTKKGDVLDVYDTVDDWTKVRTSDGFVGYVKTKTLSNTEEVTRQSAFADMNGAPLQRKDKVCMVWHQVFSAARNAELEEYLADTTGINVISPTWFSVTDNRGSLSSLAEKAYVDLAHSKGMEVWALVDDFNTEVDELALLSDTQARANMIDQLMQASAQYGLDGINVDFEGIKEESAPHFLQFIRELSAACRKAGLVLSIDNYVPSGGRSWYNLREQGRAADYVIIMGYDEYYKGSCAGPNATLSFSEQGIVKTLYSVPKEKVINGLPFFMRVWQETPEENAPEGAVLFDDGASVYEGKRYARDSRAVGMTEAERLLEEHGVEPQWLAEQGLYYGQYEEDGSTYRIWLEDERTISLKMEKVMEHQIAGAAFWKLGLENADVWPEINAALSGETR